MMMKCFYTLWLFIGAFAAWGRISTLVEEQLTWKMNDKIGDVNLFTISMTNSFTVCSIVSVTRWLDDFKYCAIYGLKICAIKMAKVDSKFWPNAKWTLQKIFQAFNISTFSSNLVTVNMSVIFFYILLILW